MQKFVSLQEIIEIYCISRKLVRDILRHYSVDCYKQDDTIYIDLKKFHGIYTSKYNPALFTVEEKVEEIQKPVIKNTFNYYDVYIHILSIYKDNMLINI